MNSLGLACTEVMQYYIRLIMNTFYKLLGIKLNSASLSLSLLTLIMLLGCVGETPQEPPKYGFYKNEPVVFRSPYDDVWTATLLAVQELNWAINNADKTKGIIELKTSYVYTEVFGEYTRMYVEPNNVEMEKSKIKPYLTRISYYEKTAPPNPKFVRETLEVNVKSLEPTETEVKANYKTMPYYDYKIGYLGSVRSNGYLEKNLFKRIQEILAEEEIVIPPPPPPIVVPFEMEFELRDIFFDFDKYYIRPDAEPVLRENAEILIQNPDMYILIEGYADIRGTDEYNLRLAQRRADATKAFLVSLGVAPSRITTASGGETTQFGAGTTEEAYQLNRRAHFIPVRPGSMPGARIFLKKASKSTL